MNDIPLDTLHDVKEVSRRLGLKPATIRRMIFEKQIAVFRPSKRAVRISERAIRAKLAEGYTPRGARMNDAMNHASDPVTALRQLRACYEEAGLAEFDPQLSRWIDLTAEMEEAWIERETRNADHTRQ